MVESKSGEEPTEVKKPTAKSKTAAKAAKATDKAAKPAVKKPAKAAAKKPAKAAAKKPAKAAAKKPAKAAAKKPAKVAAKKPAKVSAKKAATKPAGKSAAKPAKKAAAKKPAKAEKAVAKRAAKAAKATPAQKQSLRIRLRCFDYRLLDQATEIIVATVRHSGASVLGPIPLPTTRTRFDLLRSPHVDKDSRDQIEIRTYHRLVAIPNPSEKTALALAELQMPKGVSFNMNLR